MTSINTRPAPYTVGYEQPEKTAPIRGDESREASQQAGMSPDTAPPRSPVGPEQRGQFSSHSKIVNQQPQGADVKGEIAELTEKNNQLIAKHDSLKENVWTTLKGLYDQINELLRQINQSGKKPEQAPATPDAPPTNRLADGQSAPSETSSTPDTQGTQGSQGSQGSQDTQGTEQSQPQGLDKLAEEQTKTQDMFSNLLKAFNEAMGLVTRKLNDLIAAYNNSAPQKQTAPESAGTPETDSPDPVKPETPAPPQNEESTPANDSTAPAPGTVAYLNQKNQELEKQIEYMEQQFEQKTSELTATLNALTQQMGGKNQ